MRRTISAVALVLVVTLAALAGSGGVPSSPAEAHGGPRTYRLDAGPYRVLAQVSRSGDAIDETLTVKEAATGHALTAGIVTVALRRAGSEPLGPYTARPAGSGGEFEARFPPPEGSGWVVTVAVQGPAGAGTAVHPYETPSEGWGGFALMIVAGLALVFLPYAAYRWWFRPPAPASHPAGSKG